MPDTNKLKFPTGEFTHTELATLNGKTNQQVWTRYQQAIKDGVILTAGERKVAGKGKPSRLWIVNVNYVAPVVAVVPVTPATPATPTVVAASAPVLTEAELAVIAQQQADARAAKEAAAAQAKADKEAAKVAAKAAKEAAKAQAKLDKATAKAAAKAAKDAANVPTEPVTVAAAAPVTAPVEIVSVPADSVPAVELPQTVAVIEVTATETVLPEVEAASAPAVSAEPFVVAAVVAEAPVGNETFQGRPVTDTREIEDVCPICGTKCLAADAATGVYVWCPAPLNVCSANENPYGHGNNEKNAFTILVAKYGKR